MPDLAMEVEQNEEEMEQTDKEVEWDPEELIQLLEFHKTVYDQ